MLALLFGLNSLLWGINWVQALITLSICLPISMMMMYKVNVYTEDYGLMYNGSMGSILVFLTLSLMLLILLVSAENNSKYYVFLHGVMMLLLVMSFTTSNLLVFYIFFESCLIPILLMIVNWGYQPERLQASMYMVMYTIISSLPLLVVILHIFNVLSTYHIMTLSSFCTFSNMIFMVGLAAFLVKLPIYGLHIWLPKAHVEAPLGGSMILAGVLLKLGGYGMFLYSNLFTLYWNSALVLFIIFLSMCGGVIASFVCINQVDIKALIAYSSVVHMSLVVMGLLSNTTWGLKSAMVVMMAHGWASSALFLLSFITYTFVGSRSFSYTKGLLMVLPILSLMWFLFGMINMSFPPTINFLGEIFIIPVSFYYSTSAYFPVAIMMFMSVAYNMYLYTQINHGMMSSYLGSGKGLNARFLLTLFGHMLPMFIILNMQLICCK